MIASWRPGFCSTPAVATAAGQPPVCSRDTLHASRRRRVDVIAEYIT